METYSPMYGILQPGRVGSFSVTRTRIPAYTELTSWDADTGMFKGVFENPHNIIRLLEKDPTTGEETCWMSDTPMEMSTMQPFLDLAGGKVLVAGLGLGYLPWQLLDNSCVEEVTVLEIQPEIIALVADQIPSRWGIPFQVLQADAYEFFRKEPTERFDSIFLDIWPFKNSHFEEIEELCGLASRWLDQYGVLRYWLQEFYDTLRNLPVVTKNKGGGVYPPCVGCGKTFRSDYGGLCQDCADTWGRSDLVQNKRRWNL